MTYEQIKNLKPTEFKRLCGVCPETFKDMVKVLAAEKVLQKKTGRPSKLTLEDQTNINNSKLLAGVLKDTAPHISYLFSHRN